MANRWTPTPRAGFYEKEYTRCDGLRVTLSPASYPSQVELSGYTWTEDVFCAIMAEHARRRTNGGFAPMLLPRFNKSVPDAEFVYLDGTPHGWLAFLNANVPLQKINAIVVREFGSQSVEQIQSLRRDGWTILQIGEVRMRTRDILAERVEQVVPT